MKQQRQQIRWDGMQVGSLLLVLLVVLGQGGVFLRDRTGFLGSFEEDAFYGYTLLRNFVDGCGYTLDTIHPTNGFPPLYLVIYAPIFALVSGRITAIYAMKIVQLAMLAGIAVLLFRGLARRIDRRAAFLGAALLVVYPLTTRVLLSGMDSTHLALLTVLAWSTWLTIVDDPNVPLSRWFLLGTCCALCLVSRIDSVLTAPIFLFLSYGRPCWSRRGAAVCIAPIVVAAVASLGWQRLVFHMWMPISGIVKHHLASQVPLPTRLACLSDIPWPGQHFVYWLFDADDLLLSIRPIGIALHTFLLFLFIGVLIRWRRPVIVAIHSTRIGALLLLAGGTFLIQKSFLVWLGFWYFGLSLVALGAFVGSILARAGNGILRVAALVVVALGVLSAWHAVRTSKSDIRWVSSVQESADWIGDHTAPDDVIGGFNSGLISFLLPRRVVNLDGVLNTQQYFQEILVDQHPLLAYLNREDIHWIVDYGCHPVPTGGPLAGNPSWTGVAQRAEWMVGFGAHPAETKCKRSMVSVWRIPGGTGLVEGP